MSSRNELISQIEAVLFVASEPLNISQLAEATQSQPTEVSEALKVLDNSLAGHGIHLVQAGDMFSLATVAGTAAAVERHLGSSLRSDLSQPALETLAIIAYRQPATKSEIEQIRGVASDQIIKNLVARGLACEADKDPSGSKRYQVTIRFLRHFGLQHAKDLPPLDEIASATEPDESISQASESAEDHAA